MYPYKQQKQFHLLCHQKEKTGLESMSHKLVSNKNEMFGLGLFIYSIYLYLFILSDVINITQLYNQ